MSTLVAEAIEIITDDGTGIPVTYNNTAIGLGTDGHFYLITDRPTISSVTGDTTRTVWYTGILTRDYGAFSLSRSCDFVEAGAMESVSGFSFAVKNTAAFWSTLETNGVYLGRRTVKYYRVTSTDGAAWNFELRWTGVIDEQPFNELAYSIRCVDNSKEIFKSLPVQAVNSSTFPLAPSDSQDKMIPIALGRVLNSPLINIAGSGSKTTLATLGDYTYPSGPVPTGDTPCTVAACLQYTPATTTPPADGSPSLPDLLINTPGVYFGASDFRLIGKYVTVIAGGITQSVLIVDNDATSVGNNTDLYLAENLDVTTAFKAWATIDQTDQDVWYIEVVDYSPTLLASTKTIYQQIENSFSRPALSTYSSDLKAYQDVSEVSASASLSNIKGTGFPGFSILSKAIGSDGSPIAYAPIIPNVIKVAALNLMSGDLPSVGSDAPLLNDADDSTYYTLTGTNATKSVVLDVYLPPDASLKAFDELYLAMDIAHKVSAGGAVTITATAQAKDVYGRICSSIYSYVVKNSTLGTSLTDLNRLPGIYFGVDRDDNAFHIDKTHFDIKSMIGTVQKMAAYNVIRFTLTIGSIGGVTYTLHLKEIGLVGKYAVAVTSETVYGPLQGETFGTTWDGRVSAAAPIQTIPQALEHLVRNYDESSPVWVAARAYAIGDKVRGTADTGHIFVCTTAGTSHASTEPTWTDTAGATYSDGTCAWKELREIPIDTTSFDALNTARANWLIGRTLADKKPSADYYKDLFAQGFMVGTLSAAGKLKGKAWLENTSSLIAFDSTNILQDTIRDMQITPARRTYNDLLIRYDWNPGAGKFNKQIAITKVDQPAFPASTDPVGNGASLGSFSATYTAIGFGLVDAITIVTGAPHGRATGDYVSLSGNANGYDFTLKPVSVVDSTTFVVFDSGHVFSATPSTSGTLKYFDSLAPKWKTYVIGIDNYATAKGIWDQCHASYLITKMIQTLPPELGDCYWYFDPYATNVNGDLAWPDLNVGDAHAAVFYAQYLANWTAWQKKTITFEVIDNATHSALGLGDPVTFTDAKLTGGVSLSGWVMQRDQLPRTDTLPERFRFTLIFLPTGYTSGPNIIEEHGATNIIDEHGATNIYEEHGA